MGEAPKYSIVVTSRNDGHGGNIMKRMRLFTQGLLDQCRRHRVDAELIYVEWNPPPDRPRLHEVLPAPGPDDRLTIRYIEVPEVLHQSFPLHNAIPLYQMIAKNVGIRRAKAHWVLCTNIDLLFSDELMQFLAQESPQEGHFYRANRCDVPDGIDESWDLDRQLKWCSENIMRRLGWDSRFKNYDLQSSTVADKTIYTQRFSDWLAAFHRRKEPEIDTEIYKLDTDACGDFTMMSRPMWADIQGYLELDMYSIHIDSLGLVAARALGYEQVTLPREACTYHIDHPSGWEAMDPIQKLKFLEKRPGIDYSLYIEVTRQMLAEKRRFNLNPENWGFAEQELKATIKSPREVNLA